MLSGDELNIMQGKGEGKQGERLRWKSEASGNHHKPPKRQFSCENERGSHRGDSKHLQNKKPCFKIKRQRKTDHLLISIHSGFKY